MRSGLTEAELQDSFPSRLPVTKEFLRTMAAKMSQKPKLHGKCAHVPSPAERIWLIGLIGKESRPSLHDSFRARGLIMFDMADLSPAHNHELAIETQL